tara:strand:+ start:508 stop:960 length:453 start_codon:yes stop_codon:yes gene_type:complete
MKKLFPFIIILMMTHCGFTPLYDAKKKLDYNIFITEIEGDKLINNLITNEIRKISDPNSLNKITLKIKTNYSKITISKNVKGSVSDYRMVMETNIMIDDDKKVTNFNFNENQDITNISDIFEKKNYENNIIKNYAISVARNLNLKLLNNQ